jgi:hypothetical protein
VIKEEYISEVLHKFETSMAEEEEGRREFYLLGHKVM